VGAARHGIFAAARVESHERREYKMNSVTAMKGSYDYGLVALSVVLAMSASYAALDLAAASLQHTAECGRSG